MVRASWVKIDLKSEVRAVTQILWDGHSCLGLQLEPERILSLQIKTASHPDADMEERGQLFFDMSNKDTCCRTENLELFFKMDPMIYWQGKPCKNV